jgi:uncharacterized integral membrane protein (TIGR00697 family)
MPISRIIELMNGIPPEFISLMLLFTCFLAIGILFRFFGADGLYVFIAVAIVAANIHVLKATRFSVFPDPVALGTVLFGTTYLCTDLLSEFYGRKAAIRGVMLGFAAGLLMTVLMQFAIGYRPLTLAEGEEFQWAVNNHNHIVALFTPAPALLVSGMIAYLISQFHDVWIYERIRAWTKGKHLWLRNTISTCISGLIDNIIFSVLAWVILSEHPLEWRVVIFTYILGTYLFRVVVAILDTPMMYLLRTICPNPNQPNIHTSPSDSQATA